MSIISSSRQKASEIKAATIDRLGRVLHKASRLCTPITPEQLRSALGNLTADKAEILFVHSSLSRCGRFTAGPTSVLAALGEFCETLSLPTHTYCYPLTGGEPGPLFNPITTSSKTGLLTELFRKRKEAVRSIHATHSLAAAGPGAENLCAGHYRANSPCGEGTPYSRLIRQRGSVLMFAVSFQYYTLFHTAEFVSGSEFAYQHGVTDRLRVVDETGTERECLSMRQNLAPMRFAEAGDLMEKKGLVRRVALGREFLRFVPDTSKAHDFLVDRLRKTPDFLRQSCRIELH